MKSDSCEDFTCFEASLFKGLLDLVEAFLVEPVICKLSSPEKLPDLKSFSTEIFVCCESFSLLEVLCFEAEPDKELLCCDAVPLEGLFGWGAACLEELLFGELFILVDLLEEETSSEKKLGSKSSSREETASFEAGFCNFIAVPSENLLD